MSSIDLNSERAKKARLARSIGPTGYRILLAGASIFGLLCVGLLLEQVRAGYFAGSIALVCYACAAWYNRDLSVLKPTGTDLMGQLSGAILNQLPRHGPLTPKTVWHSLLKHWQFAFILNHLLLPGPGIEDDLSNNEVDLTAAWNLAARLALGPDPDGLVEPGHLAAALIITSPTVGQKLTRMKLSSTDVAEVSAWLGRVLQNMHRDKPFFGGIGRDWSNGFTPLLSRFGQNISQSIEHGDTQYDWLTDSPGVKAVENAFAQGTNAIALIGDPGIGKTSHVYALAQVLLKGDTASNLAYKQVIGLNSSLILSSARGGQGSLENIMLMLMHESLSAGHIILFLDDAQLFFGDGPGAFDATQILQPIVQSRNLRIILAMTPRDYQNLKIRNASFAALLTPVMLQEPPERDVMRVLEDSSISMEYHQHIVITYEALREAYRLSGRYETETAYPGKAIRLLEQSLPQANQNFVTETSVQRAIEQTRGVKIGTATPAETDTLLHLEDKIHERMINQTRAVSVVSSALRRARAGVSNPKRPIGSFLFLGPTGVGKTELAKAIAATYFNSETNMVRLDMSEYQQPDDVKRLLSDGHDANTSLIMAVRQQPFTVLLLDEIEKAHPNILNLLLQLLDEGELTDISGRGASFKDCIVIATSNAGAQSIRQHIEAGEKLEAFEDSFTNELISSGQFKPELLNRFDEIVLFRPLERTELAQVVQLMMQEINKTLANQRISVELTQAAIEKIVDEGYDPRLGARPMRRMLQRAVEDGIAARILSGQTNPGDHVLLDVSDLTL